MYKQQNSHIMGLYAISPVHAGSGSSTGVVDLPIQRERHSQWPHIQASGVKGAMRAHFDKFKNLLENSDNKEQLENITQKIFGSDDAMQPGAIAVSDAKILAFPMRSSIAPFIWITCPAILKRLKKDCAIVGLDEEQILPSAVSKTTAYSLKGKINGRVLLEDYEVTMSEEPVLLPEAAKKLLEKAERLILVSDDVFKYGVENCTEIQTQIKIDQETGTAQGRALRYEELLPADTIMYSLLMYGDSRDDNHPLEAETIIAYLKNEVITSHIQMGGDETLGRGLFEIEWLGKEAL